jgi:hypothetical protein
VILGGNSFIFYLMELFVAKEEVEDKKWKTRNEDKLLPFLTDFLILTGVGSP